MFSVLQTEIKSDVDIFVCRAQRSSTQKIYCWQNSRPDSEVRDMSVILGEPLISNDLLTSPSCCRVIIMLHSLSDLCLLQYTKQGRHFDESHLSNCISFLWNICNQTKSGDQSSDIPASVVSEWPQPPVQSSSKCKTNIQNSIYGSFQSVWSGGEK